MPATTKNDFQKQLLDDHDLCRRPITLPSERFNTRAAHIQCSSPATSGIPVLSPTGSLRTG
jgi:hypothetical protein